MENNKEGVQIFLRYVLKKEKISSNEKRISELVNKFATLELFKKFDFKNERIFQKIDLNENQREKLSKVQLIIDPQKDVKTNFVTYVYNKFADNAATLITGLTASKMIDESSINPFLAKALGLNNFDDMARYFVVQTISRSLVTSFGSVLEETLRAVACGKKGKWWDITKDLNFWSVKSGPNDMNKDQVTEFSKRAKKEMKYNKKALPKILMAYGRQPHSVIITTLINNGLNPLYYTATGKKVYELLSNDPNYYAILLEIFGKYKRQGKTLLNLMDEKVGELSKEFQVRYKTVNELLNDTF